MRAFNLIERVLDETVEANTILCGAGILNAVREVAISARIVSFEDTGLEVALYEFAPSKGCALKCTADKAAADEGCKVSKSPVSGTFFKGAYLEGTVDVAQVYVCELAVAKCVAV